MNGIEMKKSASDSNITVLVEDQETETPSTSHINLYTSNLLEIGLKLTIGIKETEKAMQGMILQTFIRTTLACAITLFLSLYAIGKSFNVCDWNVKCYLYFMSLHYFILWLWNGYQMYFIAKAGQHLSNKVKEARFLLGMCKCQYDCFRSYKSEFLINELGVLSESPITPYSALTLGYGALMKSVATIITYFVILVRFKIIDGPTVHCSDFSQNKLRNSSGLD